MIVAHLCAYPWNMAHAVVGDNDNEKFIEFTQVDGYDTYEPFKDNAWRVSKSKDCVGKSKEDCNNANNGCYWDSTSGCIPVPANQYKKNGEIKECSKPVPRPSTGISFNYVEKSEWDGPESTSEQGHTTNDCLWKVMCYDGYYWSPDDYECRSCPKYRKKGSSKWTYNYTGYGVTWGRGAKGAADIATHWFGRRTLNDDGVCPKCLNGALPDKLQTTCNTIYVYFVKSIMDAGKDNARILTIIKIGEPRPFIIGTTPMPTVDEVPKHVPQGINGKELSQWECITTDVTWPGAATNSENKLQTQVSSNSEFNINPGETLQYGQIYTGKGYIFCAPKYETYCSKGYYCDGKETLDEKDNIIENGRHKCPSQMTTNGTGKYSKRDCGLNGNSKFCDKHGCFSFPTMGFLGQL